MAEYLEGERESTVRHEYVQGEVYAMAGASDRHNRIALNIASRLNDHAAGGPCEAFMSDMKIKVAPEVFYYPDVVYRSKDTEWEVLTFTAAEEQLQFTSVDLPLNLHEIYRNVRLPEMDE